MVIKKRKNVKLSAKDHRIQRVAYHEAGHAVTAVIFKEKFKYAEIDNKDGRSGAVHITGELPDLACSCQSGKSKYREARIIISLAGFIAENLILVRNAQKVDLNWKSLEKKFFDNTEDYTFLATGVHTAPNNDYGYLMNDLIHLMDFDSFGTYNEKYQFDYECFFMRKCALILEHRDIWKATEAVAQLLIHRRLVTDVRIIQTCFQVSGFKEVSDHLRKIYIGTD